MLAAFFLPSCGGNGKNDLRIGIDPGWHSENFQGNEFYVNGFVEDLLLEISRHSGMEICKTGANWDSLFDHLGKRRYNAVISSLRAYHFNAAKYEFSKNILDTGPVLVVPASGKEKSLKDMAQKIVGILPDEEELRIVQSYPSVLTRTYRSAPEMFDALVNHDIEGAVIDRLLAVGYIRGVYARKMKIVGSPLNGLGLHFVAMKDENPQAMKILNQSLEHLIKKKKLRTLQKKWNLDI